MALTPLEYQRIRVSLCRCDLVISRHRWHAASPKCCGPRFATRWLRQADGRKARKMCIPVQSEQSICPHHGIAGNPGDIRPHHSDTAIIHFFANLGCAISTHSIRLVNIDISCFASVYTVKLYPRSVDIQANVGSRFLPGPFRLSGQCLHIYWPIIWKVLVSLTLLPLPGFTHTDFAMDIHAS